MSQSTVAQLLAAAFAANGVERIFGVPGGGSSLDVIEAAAEHGIDFVLTRTESAAVMMAAATAELNGSLGVALTTKGPGTANAMNGVAYASLDRAPVVLLTDGFNPKEQGYVTHQVFDQPAMLAPVTKGSSRLETDAVAEELQALIGLALSAPLGPVHIELTSAQVRAKVDSNTNAVVTAQPPTNFDEAALARAQELLGNAARPVLIVGLEARETVAAAATLALAEALGCPVLTTYKAKGVVGDEHPQYVGTFTSGSAEAECVEQADVIVLCGLDPVELLRQPWRYDAPVIDIALIRHPIHYLTPSVGLYGPLQSPLARLTESCARASWLAADIAELRQRMRSRLQYPDTDGIGPQQVVEIALEASRELPVLPRITVDAGAHMFSAMAFWPCGQPHDVLISNGLASMAFALPAAIASALHQPERRAIAFTGDGGLMMCLGELSVAAEQRTNIVVIVFNDAALSLIDIKQQQRDLPPRGVRWDRPDFAQTMEGLGGRGYRVDTLPGYRTALAQALQLDGPALIDVVIDPSGYTAQMKALRG
jgi:acetolactate synthase-1/2/3 large subunit